MIQFNILKFVDQTGALSDPQTIANLKFYLNALAQQYNDAMESKNVTLNVQLTITTSTGTGASAAPGFIYDPQSMKFVNNTVNQILTGVDLTGGAGGFILNISAGAVNIMNSQLAVKYEATPLGGLSLLVHEFGHVIGFNSLRDPYTGALSSDVKAPFDNFVDMSLGHPVYTGKNGSAIYGGAIPLAQLGVPGTSITHFTKAYLNGSITDAIASDPMVAEAGYQPRVGQLYSDLDRAVFLDLGIKNKDTLQSYDGHKFIPGSNTTSIVGTTASNDTVLLQGLKKDYVITKVGSDISETSKVDNSTVKLVNIERIQFDDGFVAYDISNIAGQAYRLYQAAFNRTPDQPGLGYWIGEMDAGSSLNQVAASFVISAEFKQLYGNNISDNTYLTALYSNVLHRAPDQAGFDYWNGRISAGMTRADILASFSESTENQIQVIGSIKDGISYMPYH